MAQRTGFVILTAMATAIRVGLGGEGRASFPVVASAARMLQTGCCRLDLSLDAIGPIRSRSLVVLLRLGPQSKKSRSVPAGAGNQDRDFGEIAVGMPVIDEAIR